MVSVADRLTPKRVALMEAAVTELTAQVVIDIERGRGCTSFHMDRSWHMRTGA
jgi:hypothetical protein